MNRDTCEHLVPTDLHCDHCADKQAAVRYIPNDVAKCLGQMAAQRDALLEALKGIDKEFKKNGRQHWPEAVKARAAIAKAEGSNDSQAHC